MDYINVATTVFTPIEYGACGYSEEDATDTFGADNIEVFHTNFWPLEWTLAKRPENASYCKLVCNKNDKVCSLARNFLFFQPAKFLKFLGKMVNFIQNFCLQCIIATIQTIKCSLAKKKKSY